MSMSISSYSSLTNSKAMTGLASGLDVDSLIDKMTLGTKNKIVSQMQKGTVLSWKRDAYREISSKLISFNSKYFSYSNQSTNILSDSFYNVSKITTSSDYVTATGKSDVAKNIVIKDISQLAEKSRFTSSYTAGKAAAETGVIRDTWRESSLVNNSVTIKYGDSDYTLTLGSDFCLDSYDSNETNVNKVITELNNQISKNSDLQDKLKFELTDEGVQLTKAADTSKVVTISDGSNNLLDSLGFSRNQSATSDAASIKANNAYKVNLMFEDNKLSGSSLSLVVNDKYTAIQIPKDFKFSSQSLERNADGTFTDAAKLSQANELNAAFSEQIASNGDLAGKLTCKIEDGKFTMKATGSVKITSGSADLLDALDVKASDSSFAGDTITGEDVDINKVYIGGDKALSTSLSGSTLSFTYNGVSKNIEFKESEKDQFGTPEKLKNYMQSSINKLIGEGKVTVTETDGKMSFTATSTDSIFSFDSSSASGVLSKFGALRMVSGESNRLELKKSLEEVATDMNTPLQADSDGKYKIKINGKEFSFDKDSSISGVISEINSDTDAGVKISYSSVTNVFNITAKESGENGEIKIEDVGGSNLATAMFGTEGNDYTVTKGKDLKMNISFDGGNTFTEITRNSNTLSVDGVTIEVKKMATDGSEENITFGSSQENDDLISKLKDFVKDYNEILSLVNTKTTEKKYGRTNAEDTETYLPLTDEQKKDMSDSEIQKWEEKAKTGLLQNDNDLINLSLSMKSVMGSLVEGTGEALYQIGIKSAGYSEGGKLYIDEDTLKKALAEDPEKVKRVFSTADKGIGYKLQSAFKYYVGVNGEQGRLIDIAGKANSISPDQSNLAEQIKESNTKLSTLKTMLQSQESSYLSKFTSLETFISKMNSQSSWLQQQS